MMIYLYLINYVENNQDQALMVINTFFQDCRRSQRADDGEIGAAEASSPLPERRVVLEDGLALLLQMFFGMALLAVYHPLLLAFDLCLILALTLLRVISVIQCLLLILAIGELLLDRFQVSG